MVSIPAVYMIDHGIYGSREKHERQRKTCGETTWIFWYVALL